MLEFKTCIVTKDKVICPENDTTDESFTRILKDHGITDSYKYYKRNFVVVDVYPPEKNFFSDVFTWRISLSPWQGHIPSWFNLDSYTHKIYQELFLWRNAHTLHRNPMYPEWNFVHRLTKPGHYYTKDYLGNVEATCRGIILEVYGDSELSTTNINVEAHDTSKVIVYGGVYVYAYDSSHVRVNDARVTMWDSATVRAGRGSSINVCGGKYLSVSEGHVIITDPCDEIRLCYRSIGKIEYFPYKKRAPELIKNVKLFNDSILIDFEGKKIYTEKDMKIFKL